jgi:hypothetical protein
VRDLLVTSAPQFGHSDPAPTFQPVPPPKSLPKPHDTPIQHLDAVVARLGHSTLLGNIIHLSLTTLNFPDRLLSQQKNPYEIDKCNPLLMQLTRNVFGPDYDPVSQPLHPNVESEYH